MLSWSNEELFLQRGEILWLLVVPLLGGSGFLTSPPSPPFVVSFKAAGEKVCKPSKETTRGTSAAV